MKNVFVFIILWLSLPLLVFAETYYCVPIDNGKYICEPAGEIKEYPNGKTSASTINGFMDSFRCHKENDKWVCVPFDEGAIILETQHKCPNTTFLYN